MGKSLCVCLLFCICVFSVNVCAESNTIIEQYDQMGINSIYSEAEEAFPGFDSSEIVETLSNGKAFEGEKIWDILINYLLANARELVKICLLIITVGYIISIIYTTQESLGAGSTQVAFLVGYCVFSGIVVSMFATVISPAKDTIDLLVTMIKAVIPTLLTLMNFSGAVNTSVLVSSSLVSMINVIAMVLGEFLISVIIATVALSVADRMSNRISVSSAVKFLRQFVKWVLMFCMAIYSGVYGVYGLAGTALDSRIGKATRFAVGSSIPVVGGVVSESIEVVISTIGAIRSITGVVGIIAICAIAVLPLIKIALTMWLLRLCASVLEPVSDTRLVQLTADVADGVSMVFAILVSVSLLLVGCIGIILISCNGIY